MKVMKVIEDKNIDVFCGTPSYLHSIARIYHHNRLVCRSKKIAMSGECFRESIAELFQKVFVNAKIYHVYGLTEAGPRVTYLSPESFYRTPSLVGKPLPNVKIKIADENGTKKPVNEAGEIYIKSPSVMRGYYRNREVTNRILKDGWLRTGDIGCIQNDSLKILSRKDDMIIKAGVNIYPAEIESLVCRIKEVKEAVAYGTREETGESVSLNVVLENADEYDERIITRSIRGILPSYLMPKAIHFVKEIEKNASGKIIRKR
jgi:acyl-CoA synthetase (AMP-forming)/AMP-acid ligase II